MMFAVKSPLPLGGSDSPARRGRVVVGALVAACILAVVLISHGREFTQALERALDANWGLVLAGAALEALSVLGYVVLFHSVVSRGDLTVRESYDVTLAGTAATRLLPTAGLGGVAVTVWALRRRGVGAREVGERMIAFLLLLYSVYMVALAASGVLVAAGVAAVPRGHDLAVVGALTGATVVLAVVAACAAPERVGGLLADLPALGRARTLVPSLRSALGRAAGHVRHPKPELAGGLAWWGFDIAVLGVMLHAFHAAPSIPVLVLAYFLGTLCNVLPLPGSLSGGLIATLAALGTPAGAAIAAVLAYRTVAVWLPAAWGLPSLAKLRPHGERAEDPRMPALRQLETCP